ncbi:MAG: sulfatase-like hydrolase/transferase [Kofleriaceae bacterium]|nr:sulfatase-like hydrolase/transferase [Myxococcales bacterium]MCB9562256.1 sulfatase-like hydrolase/transferase [Kofleriaceae bacterium]
MPAGRHASEAPPDLVVLLTDQERAAPAYEPREIARWRDRALPARRWFDDHGVGFARHYVGATACTPSRPTLLTGHYPDVHGVTQTTGLAKHAGDPRVRWLRPGEVPTLGHFLRAAGYDTHYDGKWHVSDADLRVDGAPLATNDDDGRVLDGNVARYVRAAPLAPFGFDGWVGPEPHGAARRDSGLVRDRLIADRVVRWLDTRNARRAAGDRDAARPFLLVVSFVNPHDIVFWPAWALRRPLPPDPLDPPTPPEAPTQHEELLDKPATQAAFRDAYFGMYGPPPLIRASYERFAAAYRRTYLRLHLEVDRQIDRVRRAVLAGPRADHSVLVLTSDHGELLGAHGGMHQKWGNLYDEAIRVPFVIAHTGGLGRQGVRVGDVATSHVDLLPTLLGFAGADEAALRDQLRASHTEVHPLPGVDLSPLVRGEPTGHLAARAVYVMTRDLVAEGADGRPMGARALGLPHVPAAARMPVPAHVATNLEAIVARPPRGAVDDAQAAHLWKLVRTFDDPATWTTPGVRTLAATGLGGDVYRHTPIPDAWELYDLDADPAEANNRADDGDAAAVRAWMQSRLVEERARAVPPRHTPWPYHASADGADDDDTPRAPGPGATWLRRRAVVTLSPAQVWTRLADFGAIARWFDDASHSSLLTAKGSGEGARRRVQLPAVTLVETVVVWEPGRALAYDVVGLPPIVKAARNRWDLTPAGVGTRVELTMELELAAGALGRLAYKVALGRVFARSAERLLRAFVAGLPAR